MSYDCYCDYDPPSVFRASMVRARRQYRCEECAKPISVGERYEYAWGVWDNNPMHFRTCADCVDLRRFVQTNLPCFCWAYGGLQDSIREAIQDAYDRARDEVRGLAFSVGRLIIKQRRARAAQ